MSHKYDDPSPCPHDELSPTTTSTTPTPQNEVRTTALKFNRVYGVGARDEGLEPSLGDMWKGGGGWGGGSEICSGEGDTHKPTHNAIGPVSY